MSNSKLIGVVACSGEEIPEGTVSRVAVWKALGKLMSPNIVTTCLPLFLAGHKQEREFVWGHPTVTIEGCEKRCAERAIRMFSGNPSATFVVTEIEKETGFSPRSRVYLGENGEKLADIIAEKIIDEVDKVLSKGDGNE